MEPKALQHSSYIHLLCFHYDESSLPTKKQRHMKRKAYVSIGHIWNIVYMTYYYSKNTNTFHYVKRNISHYILNIVFTKGIFIIMILINVHIDAQNSHSRIKEKGDDILDSMSLKIGNPSKCQITVICIA